MSKPSTITRAQVVNLKACNPAFFDRISGNGRVKRDESGALVMPTEWSPEQLVTALGKSPLSTIWAYRKGLLAGVTPEDMRTAIRGARDVRTKASADAIAARRAKP